MENYSTAVGEIVGFEIHLSEEKALSSSLIIKVYGQVLLFGGPDLFSSLPNIGSDFFGHFVHECMKVADVKKMSEITGHDVKVRLEDDRIIGISSISRDDYFYPVPDFEALEKGEYEIDDFPDQSNKL